MRIHSALLNIRKNGESEKMKRSNYRHEIPLDLSAPLPECAKSKPVEAKPVKRQQYDELYVKLKRQRDYWNPES